MKASSNLILREIAGEALLIPVGPAAQRIHGMITLSETGLTLWKALQQDCSLEALVQALTSEYDIDSATAKADILEFLDQLRQLQLLVE